MEWNETMPSFLKDNLASQSKQQKLAHFHTIQKEHLLRDLADFHPFTHVSHKKILHRKKKILSQVSSMSVQLCTMAASGFEISCNNITDY